MEYIAKTTTEMTFMKAICGQDPEDYILEANIRQTLLRQISITEFSFSSPLPPTTTTTAAQTDSHSETSSHSSSPTPTSHNGDTDKHPEQTTASSSTPQTEMTTTTSNAAVPSLPPLTSISTANASKSSSGSKLHSPTSLIVHSSDLFAVLSRLWKKQQQVILQPCVPFLEASNMNRSFVDLLNGIFDIDIDIISTANEYQIAPDEDLYDVTVYKCKNCGKILFTPLNIIPTEVCHSFL